MTTPIAVEGTIKSISSLICFCLDLLSSSVTVYHVVHMVFTASVYLAGLFHWEICSLQYYFGISAIPVQSHLTSLERPRENHSFFLLFLVLSLPWKFYLGRIRYYCLYIFKYVFCSLRLHYNHILPPSLFFLNKCTLYPSLIILKFMLSL